MLFKNANNHKPELNSVRPAFSASNETTSLKLLRFPSKRGSVMKIFIIKLADKASFDGDHPVNIVERRGSIANTKI